MAKSFNDLPGLAQGIILAGFAAVLAGVVFWYYVLPLSDQRDKLEKEVAQLKAENDRNEPYRQQQAQLLQRIQELEGQLASLRTIVPDEQATDEFLRAVFEDGYLANIHVRNFVPQNRAEREFYVEMPFAVRLDGTYYGLLNFFDRLAHERRITSVSGLVLGDPAGGGLGTYKVATSETVGASCLLTTYYNKPPAPAPGKK